MKAKFILTALLLVLVLVFAAACGGSDDNDSDTVDTTVNQEEPDEIETPDVVEPDVVEPDVVEPDVVEPEYEGNDNEPYVEETPAAPFVAAPAPAGHVWSLSRDAVVQGLAQGSIGSAEDLFDETPYIIAAGSPMFSIIENPFGGNALQLMFRNENWFALDIYTASLNMDLANYGYKIVIHGSVADAEGTTVILGGADGPWNWLFHTAPREDGSFTISGVISMDSMNATDGGLEQFARCFRLQTNNLTDFNVYEIDIIQVAQNHVWSLSTDSGVQSLAAGTLGTAEDILAATAVVVAAGSPIFTAVEAPGGHNGLSLSFRNENWFAMDLSTPDINWNPMENEYYITITGRVAEAEGTTVILGGADGPWNWFLNTAPEADGSFTMSGVVSLDAMNATDGGYEQFMRCFRMQTNNLVDFYIYEIAITR